MAIMRACKNLECPFNEGYECAFDIIYIGEDGQCIKWEMYKIGRFEPPSTEKPISEKEKTR